MKSISKKENNVGKTPTKPTKTTRTAKSAKTTKSAKSVKTTKTTVKSANVSRKVAPKAQEQKGFTWKKAITMAICIAIPVAMGVISAMITGGAMKKFGQFNQPPFSPPAWLFPVAWTILYVLMGIASYFIFAMKPKDKKEAKFRTTALVLYVAQLVLNFVWSPIFFLANNYFVALIVLLVMWLMTIVVMFLIRERSMPAMWCLLPYVLWCLFAMYLNVGIMLLN